jgi:rod shape-determining protein MreC
MTAQAAQPGKRSLFMGLAVMSLALLMLPDRLTSPMQSGFRRIFRLPLLAGQGLPTLAATSQHQQVPSDTDWQSLQNKIRALENHVATLEADLQVERSRVESLSGLRQFTGWDRTALIHANALMSLGPGELVINRGQQDGVITGLYAIADNAIVGQITQSSAIESRLRLVHHSESALPVYVKPSNAVAMLVGDGRGGMHLKNVRRQLKIEVGDTVHTRTVPGVLDVPIIVGRVAQVTQDDEQPTLWAIAVEPVARLQDLRAVSVVRLIVQP